jgi:hypothetical protein
VDNSDQLLVILPLSIKTVTGPRNILCLLPCTLSNVILLKIPKPHTTLTSLHASCIKNFHNRRKQGHHHTIVTNFLLQDTKKLHPRILTAEYFGKGGKIFCSTLPHIKGTKIPTRCCKICTKIKKSVKPYGFPPPRYEGHEIRRLFFFQHPMGYKKKTNSHNIIILLPKVQQGLTYFST